MSFPGGWFEGPYPLLFLAYAALSLAVHVAFAFAVFRDAQARPVRFVGAGMWGLATLIGGPLTAAIYWFIHISLLADAPPPAERPLDA